jgi:hypothetical protein
MATALQVICRALRIVGALRGDELPSDSRASDAFVALNELLAAWPLPDKRVDGYAVELAADSSDVQALTLALAEKLGPLPLPSQAVLAESMQRLRFRYP